MKHKDILIIIISFFVLVVAWVSFNLYHKWATSTISQDLQMSIIPIDPNFDQEALDTIKKRKKVFPVYELKNTKPTEAVTPTVQAVPTQTSQTSSPTPATQPENTINLQGQ